MTCGHTAADPCDKFCPECGADLREVDPNEVKPDDTRWVRFWRSFRSGRDAETYQRLSYHGTSDEEYLRWEAEKWGSDQGPASVDFRYGWEIVDCPPKKWLLEKIDRLSSNAAAMIEESHRLAELVANMEDES